MKRQPKKIGLALGGGSARGWVHVGVLRAFEKAGIPIHCVAGTSIGSLVGAFYAAGALGFLENMAKGVKWNTILGYLDIKVPKQGLVEGKKILKFLRDKLPIKTIERLPIAFGAVAADLMTGKEIDITQGNAVDAVRASVSIPGILEPYFLRGRYLVDGGVVNPVPVDVAKKLGAEIVVAVDLNHDFSQKTPWLKPLDEKSLKGKMTNWLIGKEPVIFDVIGWSANIMQDQIASRNMETSKPDFLIRPKLGPVRPFDFHHALAMIQEGERCAKMIIPKLKALIQ